MRKRVFCISNFRFSSEKKVFALKKKRIFHCQFQIWNVANPLKRFFRKIKFKKVSLSKKRLKRFFRKIKRLKRFHRQKKKLKRFSVDSLTFTSHPIKILQYKKIGVGTYLPFWANIASFICIGRSEILRTRWS